jgi:hypothetical protein
MRVKLLLSVYRRQSTPTERSCGAKTGAPNHISAKLAELLLSSGDNTNDLCPLLDQRRYHVAFRHGMQNALIGDIS